MRNNRNLFKHQILITAIAVFAIVFSMIGGSYAIFSSTSKADEYNVLKVGELEISYVDEGDGYSDILSLNGAYPISDEEGIKSVPYRFSITNTGTIEADFKIKILYDDAVIEQDNCKNNLLPQKYVKYKFDNNAPALLGDKENLDYVVYEANNLIPGSSEIHEIRLWITENAANDVLGRHFHAKVVVESIQSGVDDTMQVEYNIGDSVTLKDGSKWHVLEHSSVNNANVTLLSDYNLNSDGTYNTECGRDINSTYVCSPMSFDMDGTNSYDEEDNNNIGYFIKNTYKPLVTNLLFETTNVTIPTANQIALADNQIFSGTNLSLTSPWIITTNYWTKNAYNSSNSNLWLVHGSAGSLYFGDVKNTAFGVRPVITTSKSNIIS